MAALLAAPLAILLIAAVARAVRAQKRRTLNRLAADMGGRVKGTLVWWERDGVTFELELAHAVLLRVVPAKAALLPISADASHLKSASSDGGEVGRRRDELLDARVRRNLDILHRMDFYPGAKVEVTSEAIVVSRERPPSDDRALRLFLNLALPIVDRALRVCAVTGMEILKETTVRTGQCQVCGSPLVGEIVHCRRCRTPHHRECWAYVGRCSTFGCGSEGTGADAE
jgi:hypothetical protein